MSEGIKQRSEEEAQKAVFFHNLALKYLDGMRLSLRGGKLWKHEGWRNVVEHQMAELAAAEALSEALQLSEDEVGALCRTAVVHDWDIRLEKFPDEFSEGDKEDVESFLEKAGPDPMLMDATKKEIVKRALVDGEASFLEELQLYIDNIAAGSEIVPLEDRIRDVRVRQHALDEDEALTTALGGKFWDKSLELSKKTEQEIFRRLRERGYSEEDVASPEDIPHFIKALIQERIREFSAETQSSSQ